MSHQISDEERALLESAKQVAKLWGYADGRLLTHVNSRAEAEEALMRLVDAGAAVKDGRWVRDLP